MANEKRLIDLDEALKATHSEIYWTESQQAAVRSFLVKQPKVDAVEVVHADWKDCENADFVYCTNCKKEWNVFDNRAELFYYCPNCGAKMDGGSKDVNL